MFKVQQKNCQNHQGENIIIFQPLGKLDLVNSWRFRLKLQDCISKFNNQIVVNLNQVDYIDSAGLRCLMAGMRHADQFNGYFRLCHINPGVRLVLEVTKLDTMFDIFDSEQEALTGMRYQLAS